jgi:purine nucleosidase
MMNFVKRSTCWIVILLSIGLVSASVSLSQEKKMKVILDTDIGDDIDDAWALAFLISHPLFEPLGVTMTHGNTSERAKIACKMLHITGKDHIPVTMGRRTYERVDYQFSWAEDFQVKRPIGQPAADFIIEQVKKFPGQVTLIAVGPLQNVADVIRKEPRFPQLIQQVVLMSGCVYGTADQNSPIPEYNVYASTADSQVVYSAGLPLSIVPLDSTTRVRLSDVEREEMRKYDSPLTHSLECLYRLWMSSSQARMTLHDQLAVAQTACPGAFFSRIETLPLVVDDKGFTRIDKERGKPVKVCLEPKRDEFMRFYISQLVSQRLGM